MFPGWVPDLVGSGGVHHVPRVGAGPVGHDVPLDRHPHSWSVRRSCVCDKLTILALSRVKWGLISPRTGPSPGWSPCSGTSSLTCWWSGTSSAKKTVLIQTRRLSWSVAYPKLQLLRSETSEGLHTWLILLGAGICQLPALPLVSIYIFSIFWKQYLSTQNKQNQDQTWDIPKTIFLQAFVTSSRDSLLEPCRTWIKRK